MNDVIGPYRIESEIGRGGMGVVYRARDERLGRTVAIKALPEEFSNDAGRLERFEREARMLAQLNHPNLAGIYGLEEHDGHRYLVLEYVEGETLADRLDRGVLPVDQAVELAVKIAGGIEAAHEAGVVHRDLKPANIIVTPEGNAKVLDFGLARTDEGASSSGSGLSQLPTLTTPVQHSPTIPGAILGTAAYMSPEQARGRRVDKRTDIWSFGVILYEMLVGISPFAGETASDSIGAVLHKGFDLEALPAETPSNVRRVLRRCLERDKNLRYRDIGDARLELLSASVDRGEGAESAGGRGRLVLACIFTAVLVGVAAWAVRSAMVEAPVARPVSLSMDLGERYRLHENPRPVLSRDGRRALLRVQDDQQKYVVLRDLDNGAFVEVVVGDEIGDYGISPDGEWMFFDDERGRLKKMPLDGGPAVTVCELRDMIGGVWTEDGEILFVPYWSEPIVRVDADGGEPEPMYEKKGMRGQLAGEVMDGFPCVVPGGRWVLFQRQLGPGWNDTFVMIVPMEGGEPRELIRGGIQPRYLDTGHVVFQREDTLMAVAFDAERGTVTSSEVPVLRGLDGSQSWGTARFDVSPNGTLLYVPGANDSGTIELGRMSLEGVWSPMGIEVADDSSMTMSGDDGYLAIEARGRDGMSVEVREMGRGVRQPLPGGGERAMQGSPVWHPDSRTLYFNRRSEDGIWELCRNRIGSTTIETLQREDNDKFEGLRPIEFTSDGLTLIGESGFVDRDPNLHVLGFDEQGAIIDEQNEVLVDRPGRQWNAQLSPDDRWLVFTSPVENSRELFVVSLKDPSQAVQVSVNGGNFATWDPNADRLYYLFENESPIVLYAVDFTVNESGEFVPGPPVPLFELEGVSDVDWLDMTADGSEFYMTREVPREGPEVSANPRVIVDWDELLREQLP